MKFLFKILVYLGFFFGSINCKAQIYRSCTSSLEFEKGKDTIADAQVMKTFMIYNSGTGEFIFKLDISSIVTGKGNLDDKFDDLKDQIVLFKGNYVGQANELVSGTNDKKDRTFSGIISLNGNSQNCNIIVQSVNYADKTESKTLKLDILFDIDPVKLNIPVLKDLTQNPVEVEVDGGFVNLVN
ncbi:MAG TPA: hypothetical protein VN026_07780 [Bacteroidia bacterium]|jgi:hypothetical protein|nr:hypothetical protein [Bacteroidia bacterium]